MLQAAADWTSVLINMNADTVDTSLRTLHDGTVGQLNADFETDGRAVQQLVQKLQSKTAGQVDSVSIESLHHAAARPRPVPPGPQPELSTVASRTDTVLVVATSVSQNASGAQPQTGALEPAARRLRRRRQAADLAAGDHPMRNRLRVLAFDVLAPLAPSLALVYIGVALAWPLWWVSVCSVLCLLIVQGVSSTSCCTAATASRSAPTTTGPACGWRSSALTAVALVAAVVVGYTRWTVPDRTMHDDMAEVVGIASSVAEASATFTPQRSECVDRPGHRRDDTSTAPTAFATNSTPVAKDLTSKNLSGAGEHRLGGRRGHRAGRRPVVAVVMRGTQNAPGKQPATCRAGAAGITADQDGGRWLVDDVTPINSR